MGSQDEEDEEEVDDEVMDDAIDDDEEEEVDEEEVEDYKPKSRRGRPPGSTNKKGKPAAKSSARTSARNSTRSGRQRSRSEEIDEISSGDEDMLDDDTETASASTSKKDKDEQRLTARQRAALNDGTSDTPELMSLDIGRQQKITLTEEEQALKKAEVLRRRKHQSDQRLENEKVGVYVMRDDLLKRLLPDGDHQQTVNQDSLQASRQEGERGRGR